ncbi:aldehyde dehydrogenase family protein [Streptomyces sp. BV286]|uniref:aldehyde dehydrogenase family protein n=1 Tax=Streptomyces sp. BV286 TaxID=2849672 RepID=UPI001C2E929A|nr:aldehyde dehydrogenase family protein [Streptomyces sp. BV286]MBV1942550.1 aldehyde dehydrogenase family protein [Streptomyces sp. BV286]
MSWNSPSPASTRSLKSATPSSNWNAGTRSRALHTGFVFVNNYNRNFTGAPFGGVGASGFGCETAAETLREYGYSKNIRLVSGRGEIPRWAPSLEVTGHDR